MASLQRRRRQGRAVTARPHLRIDKLELSGRRPGGKIFGTIDTREKCLTASRGQAVRD